MDSSRFIDFNCVLCCKQCCCWGQGTEWNWLLLEDSLATTSCNDGSLSQNIGDEMLENLSEALAAELDSSECLDLTSMMERDTDGQAE